MAVLVLALGFHREYLPVQIMRRIAAGRASMARQLLSGRQLYLLPGDLGEVVRGREQEEEE